MTPQAVHVPTPVVFLDVPAGHDVHSTEPVVFFHVPIEQGVHAVPSSPVYPPRQVQIELFAYEKVLVGHSVQFVAPANE